MLCRRVHLPMRPWTARWGCRCMNPKTWRPVAVASAHERQTANKNGKSISNRTEYRPATDKECWSRNARITWFCCPYMGNMPLAMALFLAGHQSRAILSTPLLVENIFSSKSHPLHCRHRQLERAARYLELSPASPKTRWRRPSAFIVSLILFFMFL